MQQRYGWLVLLVAAAAMVGSLPGRTQGLGLVTEPLLADLGIDRVSYAALNFWATIVGAAGALGVGYAIDRLGSRFVITDGGMHHHLAASGNLGQIVKRDFPVVAVTGGEGVSPCTVSGPLCTPLDRLADRVEIPRAVPGDLIVIFLAGAYGPSASPAAFLSRPAAAEALV